MPTSITVPAVQAWTRFTITLLNNSIVDGEAVVTITAQASNFGAGSAAIIIYDDESPAVASSPSPPDLSSNVPANVRLSWNSGRAEGIVNGGFEIGNFSGW